MDFTFFSSKKFYLVIIALPMLASFLIDAITGFSGESLSVGGATLWMMATLVIGTVIMFRVTKTFPGIYRFAAMVAIGTAFLITWANGAVGIIGSEENRINLIYFVIILMGFLGATISNFETRGIAFSLFGMAFTQMMIAVLLILSANSIAPNMTFKLIIFFLALHGFFAGAYALSGFLFLYISKKNTTN